MWVRCVGNVCHDTEVIVPQLRFEGGELKELGTINARMCVLSSYLEPRQSCAPRLLTICCTRIMDVLGANDDARHRAGQDESQQTFKPLRVYGLSLLKLLHGMA